MKIDSTISSGIGVQNNNNQGERLIIKKSAPDSEFAAKKVPNDTHADVNSENVINDEMLDNAVKEAN
jgi:hypothetical protein